VVFNNRGIFVTNFGSGTVSQLDPSDGHLLATWDVGAIPTGLTFAKRHMWVANFNPSTVIRRRLRDGRPVTTIPVGGAPFDVLSAGGSIWVSSSLDANLTKITSDP
jgi:DNA-binding beta-propeller fold protein YncE